jgi:prophage tail gpP-like protein
MSELILKVNGKKYGGWQRVDIDRGMEQIAGTFSVELTERWHGHDQPWSIMPGNECAVLIDGAVVITGYVDEVNPHYDADGHGVTISGRDRTGDLVDCSAIHKGGEWTNATLQRIAADLCAPFGISVTVQASVGAAFPKFTIQQGEAVFEALDRAAKQRGVLLMSDGAGNLVLGRTGTGRVGTILAKGQNIEQGQGQFSHRDRHSQYIIKGQSPGSDYSSSPEHHTQTRSTAVDSAVTRYRPLIVIADQGDGSTYQDRAVWERNIRAGKGSRVTYTVTGWRHNGGLWMPNQLVRVQDDWIGIDDELLICQVRLSLSESGSQTTLDLCRKEAFDLIALPDTTRKHKRKRKTKDEDPVKW